MILTVRRTCEAVCGGILAVALSAGPAFAQDPAPATPPPPAQQQQTVTPLEPEPEGFTLTPFLGAGFSGDLESAPVSFGLALGYGLSERVTLEGELGLTPNATMGVPVEFDTSTWSLSANLLYHFRAREHFTPYATAGIGVLDSSPDVPEDIFGDVDESTTAFSWNIGAGLKSALTDRIGIRGDLRFINGSDLAPDFWRLYGGLVIRGLGN